MSNFPINYDDDVTLPPVYNNITEVGGDAIQALRQAVINIEYNLGLGVQGTESTLAARLGVSIDADGTIKPSALASLGLVTLPITNSEISETASIVESKLLLDYRTQDLYNYIKDLGGDINKTMGWMSVTGSKLAPHIAGIKYRHVLDHIDVDDNPSNYLNNKFNVLRNNTNSYELINEMNDELLNHHWSDSLSNNSGTITTKNGSIYPANYGHTASAIYLQTERFSTIPQTANDVQLFAEYIDNASIFLYGTRIQNLYSNGISKESRSSSLLKDGYGTPVVPETTAIAFFRVSGSGTTPNDNILNGDDIIQFTPDTSVLTNNLFDQQFANVKPGDIIRINYGSVQTAFVIKEKQYNSVTDTFTVRIAGKNLFYTTTAKARIDRSLVNDNKFGVLAISAVNHPEYATQPTLLLGDPRGAQALGNGFNAAQFDSNHYMLYLALYDTGNPLDGYVILPGIDVTGNNGATPGKYTLESIVDSTNNAFRKAGYNYRFMAFQYNGDFGIMLSDSIGNAGFSILNAVVADDGTPSELETNIEFPYNVVGVFANTGDVPPDPLGFGVNGAAIASPPFMNSYGSPEAAQNVTKLFLPLNRNNYYVNGVERDKLPLEVGQAQDELGDGYWAAIATLYSSGSTVKIKYTINSDLSQTGLAVGKTVVIRDTTNNLLVNSGRYIIESCTFNCPPNEYTEIIVYDAVHGISYTPAPTIDGYSEYPVSLYFDSDSISFNNQSATDFGESSHSFKRYFEVYIDQNGKTFTHERARFVFIDSGTNNPTVINNAASLYHDDPATKFDIIAVSPKLAGYSYGGNVSKVTIFVESYDSSTGIINAYLCNYNGSTRLKRGPVTVGKVGSTLRLYDFNRIDFIEVKLDLDSGATNMSGLYLDIQLFKSLQLDHEVMLIASCQLNDSTNRVTKIVDQRQFGNTSEKDLSTSALNYITSGDRNLHLNGVIRGFDLESPLEAGTNPDDDQIYLSGGVALVNGKIVNMNDELVMVPYVNEVYSSSQYPIQWALCVSDTGEYKFIALTDQNDELGVVSAGNRIVTVQSTSLNQYTVESSTFSDLISKRKDLTPIYIVHSSVTIGSYIYMILDVVDIRRFANDSDSSSPLRYTSTDNQGNFKSVTSLFKWLELNSDYNGTVYISNVTESITTPISINNTSNIVIDGQNSTTITNNAQINIYGNITFKNISFSFIPDNFVFNTANNVTFDNCTFTAAVGDSNFIEAVQCNNLQFINCSFEIPAATTSGGQTNSLFSIRECNNVLFENNTLNIEFNDTEIANVFLFHECSDVLFNNNSIGGEAQVGIILNESSNVRITNNKFTNNYAIENGHAYGISATYNLNAFTYDNTDLVNVGRGYIYSNVVGTLENIIIKDNIFTNTNTITYSPDGRGADRLTFIHFELSVNTSLLRNVQITGNAFYDPSGVNYKSNYKAAIAIVNTAAASVFNDTFPRLSNVSIKNNVCDKDQLILLTSKLSGSTMVYPGLVPDGTYISENTCGTIGYWISRGTRTDTEGEYYLNNRGNKIGALTLSNNHCKFISCLDETGLMFAANGEKSNIYTDYGSGVVLIEGNTTCRINVSMSHDEDSSLKIINNDLTAYWQSYFQKYDATVSDASYGEAGEQAIIVLGNGFFNSGTSTQPPNDSTNMCIISNNTISHGYTFIGSNPGFITTHSYIDGLIYSNTECIISNNILKGIGSNSSYNMIKIVSESATITGNKLYRGSSTINAYVYIDTLLYTYGIIVDNSFDNYTVDSSDEDVIKNSGIYPTDWIIRRNKNQTDYAEIPLTEGHHFNFDSGGGGFDEEGGFQYWNWNEGDTDKWIIKPVATNYPTLTEATPYNSNILRIKDNYVTSSGPTSRRFVWRSSMDGRVPEGVQLIEATLGFRRYQGIFKTTNNGGFDSRFVVSFLYHSPSGSNAKDNWDLTQFSGATDQDDVVTSVGSNSGLINVTGDNLNSTATTATFKASAYLGNIDTGVALGRSPISINLDAVWECTTQLDMMISPIIIKYRW